MSASVIMLQQEPRGPSILVEVNVTTNGLQRQNFPDQPQLRSTSDQKIILKAMRLVTTEVLTKSVLSGNPIAPIAELQKITLVLYCEGWEKAQFIPVLFLNDATDPSGSVAHVYQPTNFDNWENVDWNKSYIQYANGTSSAGTPYAVVFDVGYVRLNSMGVAQIGPPK